MEKPTFAFEYVLVHTVGGARPRQPCTPGQGLCGTHRRPRKACALFRTTVLLHQDFLQAKPALHSVQGQASCPRSLCPLAIRVGTGLPAPGSQSLPPLEHAACLWSRATTWPDPRDTAYP